MGDNKTFFKKARQEQVSFSDIFSDVFRSHSKEERARLFLAGTPLTTPDESSMLSKWDKPYMFLRILLIGIGLLAATFLINVIFPLKAGLLFPFVYVGGAFIFPVAWMIFFWEMNIPRNISFPQVLFMFLAGGVLSLAFSGLMFSFTGSSENPVVAYTIVGIVEETAKILAAVVWLRKRDYKYILSGMLVGAAVGAGFSAIESAGYAIMENNWSLYGLIARAILSFGGHVAWAAITGGALVWVKGIQPLSEKHFTSPIFLKAMAFSIGTHALWDIVCGYIPGILMCLLVQSPIFFAAYYFLKKGLSQVVMASLSVNNDRYTYALDHDFLREVAGTVANQRRPEPQGVMDRMPGMPQADVEYRIQGVNGVYGGRRFAVSARIRIGTDPAQNEMVFPAGTPGVSRVHCEITQKNGHLVIQDKGSSYGTFINGRKLPAGQPVELKPGDRLHIGSPGQELMITLKGGRV